MVYRDFRTTLSDSSSLPMGGRILIDWIIEEDSSKRNGSSK